MTRYRARLGVLFIGEVGGMTLCVLCGAVPVPVHRHVRARDPPGYGGVVEFFDLACDV